MVYLFIYRVSTIQGGAGFPPSKKCQPFYKPSSLSYLHQLCSQTEALPCNKGQEIRMAWKTLMKSQYVPWKSYEIPIFVTPQWNPIFYILFQSHENQIQSLESTLRPHWGPLSLEWDLFDTVQDHRPGGSALAAGRQRPPGGGSGRFHGCPQLDGEFILW